MARKDNKKSNRDQQRKGKAQKKRQNFMTWVAVAAVLAAGGGWIAYRNANLPGESIESMGQLHVPGNTPTPRYNSSPPTSGPHAGPARWGEYSGEVREINQVHNLEHGGMIIQYNCARLQDGQSCGDVRAKLSSIMRKARDEHGRKFILAPYSKMPHAIAVTAWTRLQTFTTPDEASHDTGLESTAFAVI